MQSHNFIVVAVIATMFLVNFIKGDNENSEPKKIYEGICDTYKAFGGNLPDLSFVNGKPFFSWDHVPVFWHSGNMNGMTDEEVDYVANHPFSTVAIEKYEAIYQSPAAANEEDKIIALATRIKTKNPNSQVIFFQNTLISFPNYEHHCHLKNKNWLLKGDNGKYIPFTYGSLYPYGTCNNDNKFTMTKSLNFYDFSAPGMLDHWKQRLMTLADMPVFSGVFVDRIIFGAAEMGKNEKWSGLMKPDRIKKWFVDFDAAIKSVGEIFIPKNKIVVGNNRSYNYGANAYGRMYEIFMIGPNQFKRSIFDQIIDLKVTAKERITHVHGDSCYQDNHVLTLSGFLISACKYSYYMCSNRFEISSTNKSPLCWKREYNEKLGAPLGEMKMTPSKSTGIRMFREFTSGTKVFIWIRSQTTLTDAKACICWKDGASSCFRGNCASMESDFKKNFPGSLTKWNNDGCAA